MVRRGGANHLRQLYVEPFWAMVMKTLDYPNQSHSAYGNILFDLNKDMSMQYSKNHQYTTNDGHLLGVLADITVRYTGSNAGAEFTILGMPNTWKLRNAVRKFHFLRNHMFREAGISKSEMGTYGKTMRPYLDQRHADTAVVAGDGSQDTEEAVAIMQQWKPNGVDPGEYVDLPVNTKTDTGTLLTTWQRSTFGTVPSYVANASGDGPETTLGPADEWTLTLADEYAREATSSEGVTVSYKSVGAVHAYNIDRQAVQVQEDDTSIDGPNNPLAQLASAGNQATGEILEIAEAQEEMGPPYDLSDNGPSIELAVLDSWSFPTTLGTHTFRNIFIPSGMFRVLSNGVNSFEVSIEVLGEFECREFA